MRLSADWPYRYCWRRLEKTTPSLSLQRRLPAENVRISCTRKEINAPGSGCYLSDRVGTVKPKKRHDHPDLWLAGCLKRQPCESVAPMEKGAGEKTTRTLKRSPMSGWSWCDDVQGRTTTTSPERQRDRSPGGDRKTGTTRVWDSNRIVGDTRGRTSAPSARKYLVKCRNNMENGWRNGVESPWKGADCGGKEPTPTRH